MSRYQRILPTDWVLRLHAVPADVNVPDNIRGKTIPATVPGCVHTDLLAAKLIPDPYVDENEPATHWIGHCDWTYDTSFEASADWLGCKRLELAFDGLDTVAEVLVNGRIVGRADNMHRRYRFDIRQAAREGRNTLSVRFTGPRGYAEAMERRMGDRPGIGAGSNPQLPHQMMRKMACNFGWDWGPQLLTCGIWRPTRIEAWSTARLGDIKPLIKHVGDRQALLDVHIDVALTDAESQAIGLRLKMLDPDGNPVAEIEQDAAPETNAISLQVNDPQCWWPVGYGEQPLYELRTSLVDGAGEILDERSHHIGLRTVKLCTEPDVDPVPGLGQGETFHFEVNGHRIFCKGANWIPDDCFPHRVTPERYRQRIDQTLAANMNMRLGRRHLRRPCVL